MKGTGEAGPIKQDQILALRPTLGYISLLYVLHVPAAGGAQLLSGELVMPVSRVMSLQGKVRGIDTILRLGTVVRCVT
jgi:hypothetical protein